jgi:hypothetical protein
LPVGFEKKTASFFSITLGANAPGVIVFYFVIPAQAGIQ